MTRCLFLLLLAAVAAADDPVPEPPFEVTLPEGEEWEAKKPDAPDVQALFKTEFAQSNPKAVAEVRVMTYPLSPAFAEKTPDAIAHAWAENVERSLEDAQLVKEEASTLGDAEAWKRDLRNDWARLTWYVAKKGKRIYVFHVLRTYRAVDDEKLTKQLDSMRTSFGFRPEPEENAERPPEPPQVEKHGRETLTFEYWRFKCVKPEGLHNVPPAEHDAKEKENNVVAKFEAHADQAVLMVRIYARTSSTQHFTIKQLAEQKIERFEKVYDETHRHEPQRDDRYKFPMASRAIRLELTGRKRTNQKTVWYLAQCRNDRQYEIEIYVSAGDTGCWDKEIRELVEGFEPLRQ